MVGPDLNQLVSALCGQVQRVTRKRQTLRSNASDLVVAERKRHLQSHV